jgi:hypothetical protein
MPKLLPSTRCVLFVLLLLCGTSWAAERQTINLSLGDSEAVMRQKMKELKAQDVTAQTRFTLYQQILGEQKYYWWELPDKAVIGVLLAGDSKRALKVVTIEIGEPSKGVAGIEHWRSQKLKSSSSIPPKLP